MHTNFHNPFADGDAMAVWVAPLGASKRWPKWRYGCKCKCDLQTTTGAEGEALLFTRTAGVLPLQLTPWLPCAVEWPLANLWKRQPKQRHGTMAEWSKAGDSSSSLEKGVGSNPTRVRFFHAIILTKPTWHRSFSISSSKGTRFDSRVCFFFFFFLEDLTLGSGIFFKTLGDLALSSLVSWGPQRLALLTAPLSWSTKRNSCGRTRFPFTCTCGLAFAPPASCDERKWSVIRHKRSSSCSLRIGESYTFFRSTHDYFFKKVGYQNRTWFWFSLAFAKFVFPKHIP